MLGSTPLFTPLPLPIGRSAGTLRAWDHVVPPSLAVPFGLAWCSVLCRWWLLQLLGRGYKFSVGFLTVGVSLSLVHCRVSLYLFCCGSAEVFRFVVYGKAVGWVSFFNREPCLLHGFSFAFRSWAGLGVLVRVLASAVYPLLVPLKQ